MILVLKNEDSVHSSLKAMFAVYLSLFNASHTPTVSLFASCLFRVRLFILDQWLQRSHWLSSIT